MRFLTFSLLALPFFASAALNEQIAMSGPILDESTPYTPQTHSQPSLADLLTIESSASIYYSYARETELSSLFGDENAHLTLLVPTNKAVMALARKPYVFLWSCMHDDTDHRTPSPGTRDLRP